MKPVSPLCARMEGINRKTGSLKASKYHEPKKGSFSSAVEKTKTTPS
jgi:hypothetical protein